MAIKRRGFLRGCSALVLFTGLDTNALWGAAAKPKLGLIGAGRINSILAELWVKAGYQVMLSARDLGPVNETVARLGPNAHAGTPEQAAAFGDVIVISVPYSALPQVGKDFAAQLKGKVVLDTCNPEKKRDGDMTKDALEKGTGAMDLVYLPGTRPVRAFNTVPYWGLAAETHRSGELVGIPLAADDKGALEVAKQLVIDAGFEPVVVGDLSTAKSFDSGSKAAIGAKALPASQVRAALGLKP
jgi:hypothetical protein